MDKHRDTYGVEPICEVLQIAPSGYRRHAACQRKHELRCARAKREDTLMQQIQQVWQINLQVYGADKVWRQMNREGVQVARCTVERLMKRLGLQGVRRGKVVRTTMSSSVQNFPPNSVQIFPVDQFDLTDFFLCLNRNESLPVSRISQW